MDKSPEVVELIAQNNQLHADNRRLMAENIYLCREIREMKLMFSKWSEQLSNRPINEDLPILLKSA